MIFFPLFHKQSSYFVYIINQIVDGVKKKLFLYTICRVTTLVALHQLYPHFNLHCIIIILYLYKYELLYRSYLFL